MVAAAVAAVLASWAFNALVHLVWRPYAITRSLRAQGVRGPDYRFFTGSLGEIKRLRAEGAAVTLDVDDHDFIPMVQPHLRKWIALYGTSSSHTWWLAYCVLRRRRSNAFLVGLLLLCFLLTRLCAWLQDGRSCTGPPRGRTCAWRT